MEHPLNIIGSRIRAFRVSAELSQNQLAVRCQLLGLDITRGTVAKIEAAVRGVCDHEVPFFARALKVEIKAFFPSELVSLKRKARNPKGARRRRR